MINSTHVILNDMRQKNVMLWVSNKRETRSEGQTDGSINIMLDPDPGDPVNLRPDPNPWLSYIHVVWQGKNKSWDIFPYRLLYRWFLIFSFLDIERKKSPTTW